MITDIGPRVRSCTDWHEPNLKSAVVDKRHGIDDRRSGKLLMDQYPVARPPYMLTTKGDVALIAIGPDLR